MSSRRTGIEDLKSDLICRVFAAPDTEEGGRETLKKASNFSNSKCKNELSAFLKQEHMWSCGGRGQVLAGDERRISNHRLHDHIQHTLLMLGSNAFTIMQISYTINHYYIVCYNQINQI